MEKGSFVASKREFRNKLVHLMSDKERNEFLNSLLKGLLSAEKSETVSRITKVIKKLRKSQRRMPLMTSGKQWISSPCRVLKQTKINLAPT